MNWLSLFNSSTLQYPFEIIKNNSNGKSSSKLVLQNLALTATVLVSFLLFTKPSLESNGSKKGISPIMDRYYSESLKMQK